MPNMGQTLRLNRLPVLGLVPEKSGTAPTTPVSGQLWIDTSVSPNVPRYYDGTTWQPWLGIGTAAGTAADAATVLVKANNLSDLTNAGTARTNLGLGTAAITNTGTGAGNTILGNDARLSDQRTPIDGSVTGGTAGSGVKIAANTITLANIAPSAADAAAGTASLRTLSITTATSAMPGGTRLDQLATSNPPTAAVSLNNQVITNLGQGANPSDAARMSDITASAAGIDSKPSARLLATTNVVIATNGLAAVDGVTPVAGDRVLLAGQTTATENGIYVAAAGAWTRATDTITPNSTWFIEEGTANHDTAWWVTNNGAITIGATAISISQFAAPTTYTGGTGITVAGTVVSVATGYIGQTSITTLGTVTTGVWNGTAVPVANGGTGATTAPAARTALGAPQAGYAVTLGAVTAGTPVTVTHGLGTQDVIAQVRDASTNEYIYEDIINASTSTITITTGISYAANALRVVVLPVA